LNPRIRSSATCAQPATSRRVSRPAPRRAGRRPAPGRRCRPLGQGRRASDAVGRGDFPIDIHDAASAGLSHTQGLTAAHDIPYGILVAHDLTNLLAAGRCVSTTHEANGSARITATCFTTGEAAGAAAALAAHSGIHPAAVDIE
jgi:hypothetical protein